MTVLLAFGLAVVIAVAAYLSLAWAPGNVAPAELAHAETETETAAAAEAEAAAGAEAAAAAESGAAAGIHAAAPSFDPSADAP